MNNEFKQYANSFQAVTVPGLSRIAALLEHFGNPQNSLKFLHVAGTNGKGSVCACLACALEDAGYKVGKYISPNLVKVNERISVNGADISDGEMERIFEKISPVCKEVEDELGIAPTQFEIWTCAAFIYFAEQKCDYVVLEVGLGGEFDATNVIANNEVAIITRLGMDHMQLLGNTIGEIAAAKCGILKKVSATGALVTVEQEPEAMDVIRQKTEEMGIRLHTVSPEPRRTNGYREVFALDGKEYEAGIPGFHQIENASLAIKALSLLGIPDEAIRSGIRRAVNPARFEILCESPVIVYDGGHNENGITALKKSLDRYFPGEEKNVVFACMKDKEIEQSLKLLSEGTKRFFFTTVKNNPRALDAQGLKEKAAGYGVAGEAYAEIGDAYEATKATGRLTLICGSLYLYKDLREYLDKK